ncbi:MAG TPA: hypothetical protein PLX06_07115 [Fimbriimonadaceae bacterium]|nr:hypothetical protein [Fimbriimonadaceae bacterium]
MTQRPIENGQELSTIDPLVWQIQLYAKEPAKRLVVILAAAIAGWLGFVLLGNLIAALLGLAAVLGATAEFWLPLHYKLDQNRASVRCGLSVTAIEWSDVKRIVMADDGWKFSPLAVEGRLSPFRGVFLRFGEDSEPVRVFVRNRVSGDVRFVEHRVDGGGGNDAAEKGGGGDSTAENGSGGDPGS